MGLVESLGGVSGLDFQQLPVVASLFFAAVGNLLGGSKIVECVALGNLLAEGEIAVVVDEVVHGVAPVGSGQSRPQLGV